MRLLSDLPTVTDSQRGALMRSFPFPDRTIDGKACNIPESCQIKYGKTRGRAFALHCLTPPCADASAQSIFHLAFDFSQRFPSFSSPIKHVLFFPTPLFNSKRQHFHHRVSSSGKYVYDLVLLPLTAMRHCSACPADSRPLLNCTWMTLAS